MTYVSRSTLNYARGNRPGLNTFTRVRGGFTLIELMVVIGILISLATLTAISVSKVTKDARLSKAVSQVMNALETARTLAIKEHRIVMVVFTVKTERTGSTVSGGAFTDTIKRQWTRILATRLRDELVNNSATATTANQGSIFHVIIIGVVVTECWLRNPYIIISFVIHLGRSNFYSVWQINRRKVWVLLKHVHIDGASIGSGSCGAVVHQLIPQSRCQYACPLPCDRVSQNTGRRHSCTCAFRLHGEHHHDNAVLLNG